MGGAAAIPFSEIASFLDSYRITDEDEREEYITFIQALDNAYLKYTFDKQKKTAV